MRALRCGRDGVLRGQEARQASLLSLDAVEKHRDHSRDVPGSSGTGDVG